MNQSLTVDQVKAMAPGVNVLTYPELANIPTLTALFGGRPAAIILVLLNRDARGTLEGHYTALLDGPGNTAHVEHFDSLGGAGARPDGELVHAPWHLREEEGEEGPVPHLTALLRDSGRSVVWNRTPLQANRPGVETCGRHCAVRSLRHDLSLPDYISWLRSKNANTDKAVVALTK